MSDWKPPPECLNLRESAMRAGELGVRGVESLLATIDEYLRSAREQLAEWSRRRDEFEEIRILAVKTIVDSVRKSK